MKSPDGNVRDSAYEISYQVLEQCAEWIDHQEELLQGTYALGSSQAEIYFANGSRLVPPSIASARVLVLPPQAFDDILPLAPNVSGFSRPMFRTTHVDLSIGLSAGNFSELKPLTGPLSNVSVPVSINIDVPISYNNSISFLSGWGFALGGTGGGSVTGFSAFLVYRTQSHSSFNPLIGIGAGESWYSYNGDSVNISATLISPTVLLGLELVPNAADILLAIPLKVSLNTTFESKVYAIEPAGIRLSLLFSL